MNGAMLTASSLLRRASRRARPWRGGGGIAAWRSAPVAILVGLVVLAVAPCVYAQVPGGGWQLGYSDAGDHNADVTALELKAAPPPEPSGAPLLHLQFRPRPPGAQASPPSRARVATRDRSPPAH